MNSLIPLQSHIQIINNSYHFKIKGFNSCIIGFLLLIFRPLI